jgi:polyferredoxin
MREPFQTKGNEGQGTLYLVPASERRSFSLSPFVRKIVSALVIKRVWCGWNTPNAIIGQMLNLVATVDEL